MSVVIDDKIMYPSILGEIKRARIVPVWQGFMEEEEIIRNLKAMEKWRSGSVNSLARSL